MPTLRHTILTGLVCTLGAFSAVALAACSDDDIFGDDADQQIELTVTESDLSPGRVEADAGEVEFVVHNDGDRLHAFAVDTPDGVERTETVKPGDTVKLTVGLPAGRYRMYDPRGGYRNRGVTGTVVVRSDRPATVTERTVEKTVIEEDDDIDVPEIQEPEVQEPPAPQPPAPQPPPVPTVTRTVPAPPPPPENPQPPAETTP